LPRLPLDKIQLGMQLSRHAVNNSGVLLLERGTVITDEIIGKLRNAEVRHLFVADNSDDERLDEMLSALEKRFAMTRDEPHMGVLKELLREHMEDIYT
jgi:hypothetical protein